MTYLPPVGKESTCHYHPHLQCFLPIIFPIVTYINSSTFPTFLLYSVLLHSGSVPVEGDSSPFDGSEWWYSDHAVWEEGEEHHSSTTSAIAAGEERHFGRAGVHAVPPF